MIVEKLMMPYQLVSHHTIVHATLLVLYICVLILVDIEDDCEIQPIANKENCESLNTTYNYMIGMHACCFCLHFFIKFVEIRPFLNMAETNIFDLSKTINRSAFFPKFLLAVKIFLYLGSVSTAQYEIFEKYCTCGKFAPKGGILV